MGSNIRDWDTGAEARWREEYSAQRANMAIHDLIEAENIRAREIAGAVDGHNIELAQTLSQKDAPITVINDVLRFSNIPIEISVSQDVDVVARKHGSEPFPIAELSDGERNAILIASNVLTVKTETLILIDEPERHLHRSIISPLLTDLFARRPDCAFVISTHDVMLPLDNPRARTVLVRDCCYKGHSVESWDVDLVTSDLKIDDDLKRDILGTRRRVLFVEGSERSLDKLLYGVVFPNISVVAKSGWRNVEHAVVAIREANDLHWLTAWGIVDRDRRTDADIEGLRTKGIHGLAVYSVESIYYHPRVLEMVAKRSAAVTGDDAGTLVTAASHAAITVVEKSAERLCEKATENAVREEVFRNIPSRKDIAAQSLISISIDVKAIMETERQRFQKVIEKRDLSVIFSRYPVRETGALAEIAWKLGFQDREQYEGAVRKLLTDSEEALIFVRSLFGTLADDISVA